MSYVFKTYAEVSHAMHFLLGQGCGRESRMGSNIIRFGAQLGTKTLRFGDALDRKILTAGAPLSVTQRTSTLNAESLRA